MNRNKDAYLNYVCPYCMYTLDKCVCKLFPPYHLLFIDANIQEHIRILNKKGYITVGCCEGHRVRCLNTYIAFARNYFNNGNTPKGFKYDKKRKIVTFTYPLKWSDEEMERAKVEKLDTLLKWCKDLPNIQENNE